MRFDLSGEIAADSMEWIYDWFDEPCTTPRAVRDAISQNPDGESLDVYINSPGGDVQAGQEIYTLLREYGNINIYVESAAYSAASIIAMAGHCEMSPVATMMVHNVSMYGAGGDYHQMQQNARILRELNTCLANAYAAKSGMTVDEAEKMMDKETWLSANHALELGLIDGIMFQENNARMAAAYCGMWLTDEKIRQATEAKEKKEKDKALCEEILADLKRI